MFKAPKGGMVSAVNGQFYEGGEFVPDHGKYCGKGSNRVTKDRLAEVAARMALAPLYQTCTLRFSEINDRFEIVYPGGNIMMGSKNLGTLAKLFK